jgi:hypothetical protein
MPQCAGGVGGQRGEPLYPPEDGDVVHVDTTLGQQFLNVAVGQSIPQVSADRDGDHPRREPEPGERRPMGAGLAA